MICPSQSPNTNTIQNVWATIKEKLWETIVFAAKQLSAICVTYHLELYLLYIGCDVTTRRCHTTVKTVNTIRETDINWTMNLKPKSFFWYPYWKRVGYGKSVKFIFIVCHIILLKVVNNFLAILGFLSDFISLYLKNMFILPSGFEKSSFSIYKKYKKLFSLFTIFLLLSPS